MQSAGKTEHKYMVARLNNCITGDEHALFAAYQSGKGELAGQCQVFDRASGNLGAGASLKFCNLGVGEGKAFGRR